MKEEFKFQMKKIWGVLIVRNGPEQPRDAGKRKKETEVIPNTSTALGPEKMQEDERVTAKADEMDTEERQRPRESEHNLSAASSEAPRMRVVSEMEADQTFDEVSDRRADSETQTKNSTNVADTRAKQANKRRQRKERQTPIFNLS